MKFLLDMGISPEAGAAASRAALPSVVVFRLHNMKPESVIFHLRKVLDQAGPALERGAIVSVADGLIRVRTLPVAATGH
jgi:predicted nuclease of predicted toxin-antitoxin system